MQICITSYLSCWLLVLAHHLKDVSQNLNRIYVQRRWFCLFLNPESDQGARDRDRQYWPSSLALENDYFFITFISCLMSSNVSLKMAHATSHLIFLLLSLWWNTVCILSGSVKIDLISSDCCLNSDSFLGLKKWLKKQNIWLTQVSQASLTNWNLFLYPTFTDFTLCWTLYRPKFGYQNIRSIFEPP